MPIKDKSLYPKDWPIIRQRVLERDSHKCKQCGAPQHVHIMRSTIDPFYWCMDDPRTGGCRTWEGDLYKWSEAPEEYDTSRMIYVVLTVAHLDHNPQNNADDNLATLCQRCHLVWDKDQHVGNSRVTRAETRQRKMREKGQQELL